ncbi:MAG: hypothetical protein PVI00_10625 [Desulfobacterales bacterium]|jgi:hypothetical protein
MSAKKRLIAPVYDRIGNGDARDRIISKSRLMQEEWQCGCLDRVLLENRTDNVSGNSPYHLQSTRPSTRVGIAHRSTCSMDETNILQGGQNFLGLPRPVQINFMR